MLVNTEGGRCYSPQEITGWLKKAGFKKSRKKILEDTLIIEATKN